MAKLLWVVVWTAGVAWVTVALVDGEKHRPVVIQAECLDGGQHPPGAIIPWQPVPKMKPLPEMLMAP